MVGRLIIIASHSDSGALEFARKVAEVLKVFFNARGSEGVSVNVVNAQQIYDYFILNGYEYPSSEEAAKAHLTLREAFSTKGPNNPSLVNIKREVQNRLSAAGDRDITIVTDVRNDDVVEMLQTVYGFERPFFLNADKRFRSEQLQKRFSGISPSDTALYLHPFRGDVDAAEIKISTEEDLDLQVMEFVKAILSSPPKGAEGASLGGELHEQVV